jgi:predicted dithiol-disulfide oxidoreductase (DUF899 family)
MTTATATTQIVQPTEYLPARLALLEKEKALTRTHDAIAAERRALPVSLPSCFLNHENLFSPSIDSVLTALNESLNPLPPQLTEITKPYTFTGLSPTGEEIQLTLPSLFSSRRQLIIKHFMFAPSNTSGCVSCSMSADYLVALEHLHSRNTSLVVVSRAPIQAIQAYKTRMGWTFPWVSSFGSDFNYDFHVTQDPAVAPVCYNFRTEDELRARGLEYSTRGEQPGISCFVRGGSGVGEEGRVYHSYSTYARGLENTDTLSLLDLTYFGRQEVGMQPASKRRDEYTAEELGGSS